MVMEGTNARYRLDFFVNIQNLFNNVNFNPVQYTGSTTDSYQVTGAVDQSRTMQMAFRFSF